MLQINGAQILCRLTVGFLEHTEIHTRDDQIQIHIVPMLQDLGADIAGHQTDVFASLAQLLYGGADLVEADVRSNQLLLFLIFSFRVMRIFSLTS